MNTLRILMLEDNLLDATVINKQLDKLEQPFELKIVQTGAEYLDALNHAWDLILCDHQLPDFDSIQALRAKNLLHEQVPFILITGAVPEIEAVELVREGADDYILKDRLHRLPLAIKKTIATRDYEISKRSAEASLLQLTQRFQLAAKASFDIIWDYDPEKDLIYCSEAIEKVLGIPYREFYKPEYLQDFIYEEDRIAMLKSFTWILAGSEHRWRKIFRIKKKDGATGWINSNAMVLRDAKERVIRIAGVMQEVTEIRQLQHELMEHEHVKQRELAEITIAAQEKEREEIGRELHDNVNQLLATAKIMIDTARSIPDMHDVCLAKSQESIIQAISEIRNIAHSMMPPSFEKYQFNRVLRDLVHNLNLTGDYHAELDIPLPEAMESVSNSIKLAFYRIIQEQISNIIKYARAKHISVTIKINEQVLSLTIADDGVGYKTKDNNKGIGLKNMESRVRMFDGSMSVISSPGEGCVVWIQVPLRNGNLVGA